MKFATYEELRWHLTRVAQVVVDGKRVVVTFHGKPKFALVPLADLELLEGKPVAPKPTKRKPK